MWTVLVFPCESYVGQDIFSSLEHEPQLRVLGVSMQADWLPVSLGEFLYTEGFLGVAPDMHGSPAACAGFLAELVRRHGIDAIFPATDAAQLWLSQHLHCLSPAKLVAPGEECGKVCRSKRQTYQVLAAAGVRCPRVYGSADQVPDEAFPVFVKPDVGQGSAGCRRVATRAELAPSQLKPDTLIVELLPGAEYTIECFSGPGRRLLFAGARQRQLVSMTGISLVSQSAGDAQQSAGQEEKGEDDEYMQMARSINAALPLEGGWFFQAKRNSSGDLAVLEVAARLPSAMALHRAQGVNFPLLALRLAMGGWQGWQGWERLPAQPRLALRCGKLFANHFRLAPGSRLKRLPSLVVSLEGALLLKNASPPLPCRPCIVSLLYEARAAGCPVHLVARANRSACLLLLDEAAIHKDLFASVTPSFLPTQAPAPSHDLKQQQQQKGQGGSKKCPHDAPRLQQQPTAAPASSTGEGPSFPRDSAFLSSLEGELAWAAEHRLLPLRPDGHELVRDLIRASPRQGQGGKEPTDLKGKPEAAGQLGPEAGLSVRKARSRVPIIMYHDVTPASRPKDVDFDWTDEQLRGDLELIRAKGFTVVSISALLANLQEGRPLPDRSVVLTFDDAYMGLYTHAFPLLKEFAAPACYYVHIVGIGLKNTKDHFSWEQMQEMVASGLIEVGSHTINHPDLRALTRDQVARELQESKRVLENRLGYPVRHFAYPAGHRTAAVVAQVKEAGYEMATTCPTASNGEAGFVGESPNLLEVRRFEPGQLREALERSLEIAEQDNQ